MNHGGGKQKLPQLLHEDDAVQVTESELDMTESHFYDVHRGKILKVNASKSNFLVIDIHRALSCLKKKTLFC